MTSIQRTQRLSQKMPLYSIDLFSNRRSNVLREIFDGRQSEPTVVILYVFQLPAVKKTSNTVFRRLLNRSDIIKKKSFMA